MYWRIWSIVCGHVWHNRATDTAIETDCKCDCDLYNVCFAWRAQTHTEKYCKEKDKNGTMTFLLPFIFVFRVVVRATHIISHFHWVYVFDLLENVDANVYGLTVAFGDRMR